MPIESKVCPRDGVVTKLACAHCQTPICPACLTRTAVGMECPSCGGDRAVAGAPRRPANRLPKILAVAMVVIGLGSAVGLERYLSNDSVEDGSTADTVVVDRPAALNQELAVGPYAVTVTQFQCGGAELGTPPATRVASGRFCVAYLGLRNTGTQPEYFGASIQGVSDGSRTFAPSTPPTSASTPPSTVVLEGGIRELLGVRLNPEQSIRTALVFDLPTGFNPTIIQLRFTPRTPVVRVQING